MNDLVQPNALDLLQLEDTHPDTLLNNCSYDLWRHRYPDLSQRGTGTGVENGHVGGPWSE